MCVVVYSKVIVELLRRDRKATAKQLEGDTEAIIKLFKNYRKSVTMRLRGYREEIVDAIAKQLQSNVKRSQIIFKTIPMYS
jgi:hypothetical protein